VRRGLEGDTARVVTLFRESLRVQPGFADAEERLPRLTEPQPRLGIERRRVYSSGPRFTATFIKDPPMPVLSRRVVLPFLCAGISLLAGCGRTQAKPGVVPVESSELLRQIEAGQSPLIVDVRTPEEFAAGHVPGAINIPYDQMPALAAEIVTHKEQAVVLYCRSGRRSGLAAMTLVELGFSDLRQLSGDMPGWEAAGYPVVR
jgi:rhodanese-related sulfurtransferase